ncbi:MAG: hypothetical protein KZQ83_09545 [gamma proteobacterium symbiont of Taylorina sp.]|nr:hypothetical protein [gamma proteobacterium symbiont of Taylorina sp.]
MNKKLLENAVKQGIISKEQAVSLLDFFEMEKAKASQTENTGEQLKFMRSFGDIFIALGVILLAFTTSQLAVNITHQLITIIAFFLLAEWLVGYKRLVLPGITILLSILYFVNGVADMIPGVYESLDVFLMISAALLFYIRYKMPFSLYPVAVGCIYLSIELSGINVIEYPYIFILLGMMVFIVAMWYDSRDTLRVTSLSDNGFWLHLLAAPLIVHGVMVSLFLSNNNGLQDNSFSILLLFTLFFFIALFVDRRAILISSFAYALYVVFKFAYQQFMQVENMTLFIFIGVGIFIIFFGTYWYKVRKLIFSPFSSLGICKLVPDFDIR